MLGRKTKNKSEEIIVSKKGKYRLFDIELPYSFNITYIQSLDGKLTHGTITEDVTTPLTEEEIRKKMKELGHELIEIKRSIARVYDQCPCGRRGIPKIERKDTTDKRLRIWKNKGKKQSTKRPDEYWFTFDHKTEPKKCRIMRFLSPFSSPEVKMNKRKQIKIEEFVFPYATGYLKNQELEKQCY